MVLKKAERYRIVVVVGLKMAEWYRILVVVGLKKAEWYGQVIWWF